MGMQYTCESCGQSKNQEDFFTFKRVCTCKTCNNKSHYLKYKSFYLDKGLKRRSDPKKIKRIRKYDREWKRNRRLNNPQQKIKDALRNRIYQALRGIAKSAKTVELLGCGWGDFVKYIEAKMMPNMTWSNYGKKKGQWNIDHIRPLASFDLTNPSNQFAASHFTNLQPMWAEENSRKNNKVVDAD